MGNSALTFQDIRSRLDNIVDQSCQPKVGVRQVIGIGNIETHDNCEVNIRAVNRSNTGVECSMEAYATTLAQMAQSATTEQKVGLGLNSGMSFAQIQSDINQRLNQACNASNITEQIIGTDPGLINPKTGEPRPPNSLVCYDQSKINIDAENNATARALCVQMAVSNATQQMSQASSIKQSGLSIVAIIVIAVVSLLVLSGAYVMFKRVSQNPAASAASSVPSRLK